MSIGHGSLPQKIIDELRKETFSQGIIPKKDIIELIYVIKETGKANTTLLLNTKGYFFYHAVRILDTIETMGLIGPMLGARPREVYLDKIDLFLSQNK